MDSKRSSHLRCPICKEFAKHAVETECCAQIFCLKCLSNSNTCPNCSSKPLKYSEASKARKVIAVLEPCPYGCGGILTRSTARAHKDICPQKLYNCPETGCNYSGIADQFLEHLNANHTRLILMRMSTLPAPPPAIENENRPGQYQNRAGNLAQMGVNAKFYCGVGEVLKRKRLSNQVVKMEIGHCGPASNKGSNCDACMELDIQFRGLAIGHLVNADGVVSHAVACIHGTNTTSMNTVTRRRGSFANIKPCSLDTCGSTSIYYCEKPFFAYKEGIEKKLEAKCQSLNRCSACEILRYQLEHGAYKNVWNPPPDA